MAMTDNHTATTDTRTGSNAGRPWVIAGFVCAIAAIVIAPIILGPMGAVFGFIGYSKGDRLGLWVGIGAIVATIAGLALGAAVFFGTR